MKEKLVETMFKVCGFESMDYYKEKLNNRNESIVLSRQFLAWVLSNPPFNFGYTRIGRILGKDHATIISSVKKINNILSYKNHYKTYLLNNMIKVKVILLENNDLESALFYDKYISSNSTFNVNISKYNEYLFSIITSFMDIKNKEYTKNILNILFNNDTINYINYLIQLRKKYEEYINSVNFIYVTDDKNNIINKKMFNKNDVIIININNLDDSLSELKAIKMKYPKSIYISGDKDLICYAMLLGYYTMININK